jgi:hypothetical protein
MFGTKKVSYRPMCKIRLLVCVRRLNYKIIRFRSWICFRFQEKMGDRKPICCDPLVEPASYLGVLWTVFFHALSILRSKITNHTVQKNVTFTTWKWPRRAGTCRGQTVENKTQPKNWVAHGVTHLLYHILGNGMTEIKVHFNRFAFYYIFLEFRPWRWLPSGILGSCGLDISESTVVDIFCTFL